MPSRSVSIEPFSRSAQEQPVAPPGQRGASGPVAERLAEQAAARLGVRRGAAGPLSPRAICCAQCPRGPMMSGMAERPALTLEKALDQLAQVHPREFVRTRQSLAGELETAGDAKAAAALRARKRPPLPVWAANRLALEAGDDVSALIDAVGKVRAAQLGRGRAKEDSAVSQASRHQRELINRLMRRAQGNAAPSGCRAGARPPAPRRDHPDDGRSRRPQESIGPPPGPARAGTRPARLRCVRRRGAVATPGAPASGSAQARPASSSGTSKESSERARLTVVPRSSAEDRGETR